MRFLAVSILALAGTMNRPAAASSLCESLRIFAQSVAPDQSQTIEFHTSWGSGFKDDSEPSIASKRCVHGGNSQAKAVCAYLMEEGAIEFAGNNVKHVIACLSKGTQFSPHLTLDRIELSFSYGDDNRGSRIEIDFSEDDQIGGMVLTIKANGY